MKGSASVMVRAVRNQCLVSLMFFCVILKSQPFADALARLSTRLRAATLEQIRVGWNRQRRSTDPVNLLYLFEVDRIHIVRWNRAAVPPDIDPISPPGAGSASAANIERAAG